MLDRGTTFESLRAVVEEAVPATAASERRISWVGGDRRLAVARNNKSELELFLVGEAIGARERVVRDRLVHDEWHTVEGEPLRANRLRLPHGDHFDAIAATIMLELLDKGYERDPSGAFGRTESLIALALEPSSSGDAALTGLAGELLTMASMVRSEPASATRWLDAWHGWGRSSRDFQLGSTGVEVKTSTTGASRHHIQGWYQVECGAAVGGVTESQLHLLSIGVQWLPQADHGPTIETLVKEIVRALPASRRGEFIEDVRGYCGLSLLLDEDGTASQVSLRRPFLSMFERLYDLRDERIRIPRSGDLVAFTNIVSDTVAFEIELPEKVRGNRNPVTGMTNILSTLLTAWG